MRARPVLEGITVVSLEHAVALPFATRQLADLGARVIKVERPGVGDFARAYDRTIQGQSSYFVWLNRGKESVELDLKDPADLRLLESMVAQADVFAQNLAPGSAERLGLGSAELRRLNPDVVTCSVSGYGPGGSYSARKAYDLLIQCEAGLVAATGNEEGMAKVGISVADIATGMYAYAGILTALLRRASGGPGSDVEVSMLEALGEWMTQPLYHSGLGTGVLRRTGLHHATIAPYGPFGLADGSTIFLAVQSDPEWHRLCREVLRDAELAADPRFTTNPDRVEHLDVLVDLVSVRIRALVPAQVRAALDEAGIACASLRTPREFAEHAQLRERDRWRTVGTPGGPVPALLPPADLAGVEPVMGDVPALGAHTASIRSEFAGDRT